jgi:hypothetical protein
VRRDLFEYGVAGDTVRAAVAVLGEAEDGDVHGVGRLRGEGDADVEDERQGEAERAQPPAVLFGPRG